MSINTGIGISLGIIGLSLLLAIVSIFVPDRWFIPMVWAMFILMLAGIVMFGVTIYLNAGSLIFVYPYR